MNLCNSFITTVITIKNPNIPKIQKFIKSQIEITPHNTYQSSTIHCYYTLGASTSKLSNYTKSQNPRLPESKIVKFPKLKLLLLTLKPKLKLLNIFNTHQSSTIRCYTALFRCKHCANKYTPKISIFQNPKY